MTLARIVAVVVLSVLALATGSEPTLACEGTPKPSCPQTIWLAKYGPSTVVYPGAGVPVILPVGLVPYVEWIDVDACAKPSAATLTLTITCTPLGGGTAVTDTFDVPVEVPTVPGFQVVLDAPPPGGVPIPFGLYLADMGPLAAPGTYVCSVVGEYSVTFTGGTGSIGGNPVSAGVGTITGVGDVEICVIEPSPLDPSKGRLHMERLDIGFGPYDMCRKGDQTVNYFLIENNDPDEGVALNFVGSTNQIAGLPTASTSDAPVYAISHPGEDTDEFPQQFAELLTDPFLPLPDPMGLNNGTIERGLFLAPHEIAVIPVAIRSFGMCADGSCCDVQAKVTGTFTDGDPALACAGTVYVVADVPAKSPLCEVWDTLSTMPPYNTAWTGATFNDDSAASTWHVGNLDLGARPLTQQTLHEGQPFAVVQPPLVSDYNRFVNPVHDIKFALAAFDTAREFARTDNAYLISGLSVGVEIQAPLVKNTGGAERNYFVEIDAQSQTIGVFQAKGKKKNKKGKEITSGPLAAAMSGDLNDGDVTFDYGVTRTFICDSPGQPSPILNPNAWTATVPESLAAALRYEYTLGDRVGGGPLGGSISFTEPGFGLVVTPTVTPGETVILDIDPTQLALSPQTSWGVLNAATVGTVPTGASSVYAGRRVPDSAVPPQLALNVTLLKASGFFGNPKKNKKSKVTLKALIDVPPGFEPEGKVMAVRIGDFPLKFFELDAKGKGTQKSDVEKAKAVLKLAVKNDQARITLRSKGGPLANELAAAGLQNANANSTPFQIPVTVFFCFEIYETTLAAVLKAAEDKKFSINFKN